MSFSLYQRYTIFYPFIKLLIAGQGTHWLGFDSNHHLCLPFPARHLFQRAVVRFKLISLVYGAESLFCLEVDEINAPAANLSLIHI